MARYMVLGRENPCEPVFLKDGFVVLAFLFPVLWFLVHRMWREAFFALLASVAIPVVAGFWELSQMSGFFVLLLQFAIGLEAQNLRAARFVRQGYRPKAAFFASSIDEAEIRYFHAISPSHDKTAAATPRRGSLVPTIGLFA